MRASCKLQLISNHYTLNKRDPRQNVFSFLLGEGTGDWNFGCCPWEEEARRVCTDINSTRRCWRSSTFSAAPDSKRTGPTWAGAVSGWAAGQNGGYVWFLKRQPCWEVCVHGCLLIAEVTKLKMQLEVPGLAGTYTSSTDRKLEEGQKVGSRPAFTSLFFLLCECVNSDLFFCPTEPAPAALGPAAARYGPAVWWAGLLSQHRRREAETCADRCRWDVSQTGTGSFKVYPQSVQFDGK